MRRRFIHVAAGTAAAPACPPWTPAESREAENPLARSQKTIEQETKPVTHPVVHFEIGCRDSAKTEEFYKKLWGRLR